MKKRAARTFIRSFVKSIFIVLILLGAGVLSYRAVIRYLKVSDTDIVEAYSISEDESRNKEEIIKEEGINEASVDDVSRNLIYCIDNQTGKIDKILLEIFHCKNKKLSYITIPVKTQFTMTDILYRRLITVNPSVPQVIKLSNITKYFDQDAVYDYGVLLMEDLLKIKISYYTVIPKELYITVFGTENLKAGQKGTLPKEIFSEEYRTFLSTLTSMQAISNYLEEIYPFLQSNLSLTGKMNYLESYSKTTLLDVYFEMIRGTDSNSAYSIDTDKAEQQLKECLEATDRQ
ncbi:MAG: putative rane protein [Herbinix sp.]|nr:putative rane protein [Herbinix sp.]